MYLNVNAIELYIKILPHCGRNISNTTFHLGIYIEFNIFVDRKLK